MNNFNFFFNQKKMLSKLEIHIDRFNYDPKSKCSFYFLSHIHTDHISAHHLNNTSIKSFMSKYSYEHIKDKYPKAQNIRVIEYNKKYKVKGKFNFIALQNFHCHGAMMFVFVFDNSKTTIVYTGDLVLSPNWKSHKIWNSIDTIAELIYDNTLCMVDTSKVPSYQQSMQILIEFLILHRFKSVFIKVKQIGHDYCKSMLQKFITKNNFKIQIEDTNEKAQITILPTLMWFLVYNHDSQKIHKDEKENVYRLCWNTHFTNESFEDMTHFLAIDKNIDIKHMIGLCDKPIEGFIDH